MGLPFSGLGSGGTGTVLGGGGGSTLPAGGTVDDVLRGDETWADAQNLVEGTLADMLGGDPAGTTIASDGLGGLTGARTGTRMSNPLAAGEGWTLNPLGGVGSSSWSYEAGDVVRLTINNVGLLQNLDGPKIERGILWDAGVRWRIRVTPVAYTHTSGGSYGCLYLRNSASTAARLILIYGTTPPAINAGGWAGVGGSGFNFAVLNNSIAWNGLGTMELRISENGTLTYGVVGVAGLFIPVGSETLSFIPSHVGLVGACEFNTLATFDFRDLVIETFG